MGKEERDILKEVNEPELLLLLEELIRIPSPTGEEKGLSDFVVSYARSVGFTTIHQDDRWNVVARIDGAKGGPKLLFLTHMDHPRPTTSEEPHCPKVLEGNPFGKAGRVVVGKGSVSPKGTLAAMLYAGKIVASETEKIKGSFILSAVGRDLLANHDGIREVTERGWIKADMAVTGEPTGNQPVIGARGINHITITIPGVPSHWGRPEDGINPIWSLGEVLEAMHRLTKELPSENLLKGATLAPIDIQCDMSPPWTPGACRILLDRRTLPGEDTDTILKTLQKTLDPFKRQGQEISVRLTKQMYPFEGSSDHFISKKIAEVNEKVLGRPVPFGYLTFATNAGFLTQRKIPAVVYGPGRMEDVAPDEHIEVERLMAAARVYARTAQEILIGETSF